MSSPTDAPSLPLASRIESLVFASGKPISLARLAKLVEAPVEKVAQILDALQAEYKELERGVRLVRTKTTVQMVSAPENAADVTKLFTRETQEQLSDVALETLAIIAYAGPLSRSDIEAIRGVNCTYILRSLQLRGLVEKQETEEKSTLGGAKYAVTMDFLRHLGVSSLEELPAFPALSKGLDLLHAAQ